MHSPAPPQTEVPPRESRGELGWIEWIRRRTATAEAGSELQVGIGDDCAVLRPRAGEDLLVTTDFTLEGRHFRRDWHPARSAGHRALARGLSDLAAMGARPMAAFLSLALPRKLESAWTEEFLEGLLGLAERFAVPLAGGDTSESPTGHVLADIVLLGGVPQGTALRRSGARVGDRLYVTGTLGGSAAELEELKKLAAGAVSPVRESLPGEEHPQLYPEPRIGAGLTLRSLRLATACMDLSDGLSTDLTHLCNASGVGAVVFAERLPASGWLSGYGEEEQERLMLHGGEDYELLFTAGQETAMPERVAGVPVTCIGSIVEPAGEMPVRLRRGGVESALHPAGWEHLRG